VAREKLDTGQQFYENQEEIDGPVSSHMAGQQRGAKGQMAVRVEAATRLVIGKSQNLCIVIDGYSPISFTAVY
jgi:hypothetical protein